MSKNKQPPNSSTPKDATKCGPCLWVHQPQHADERTYFEVERMLDLYLDTMHKRFTESR